jgi:dihydrofolate reductase
MRKITIVAAMTKDRVIGYQGGIPWHIPGDLAHFKRVTLGKPVIMGTRTFESLKGMPLPGREIIVVSRSGLSLEQALEKTKDSPEVIIAGGAEIYSAALPVATHMILSEIPGEYPGDTFFPEYDSNNWIVEKDEPQTEFRILSMHRK